MTILTDFLLIITIFLIGFSGWKAGFTRSFFACLAGFISILAASKYPNQEGINFYLIFAISTVVVFMRGAFVLRAINFFYMTAVDRTFGAILGALVWTIVAVNIVIPSFDYKFRAEENPNDRTPLYRIVDETIRTQFPIFRRNTPKSLETNINQQIEYISQKAQKYKEIVKK
ncbi:MAG: hypothetical protein LBV66_00225 [Elusimicrobiota bacterium]|jgi:uncharacterized membrane protein required for colicin V production|nr:hypothetical protein [Elusimicrobiota bacterium]